MLKAGALLYAMFLVLISALISSSFILVNYYNASYVMQAVKEGQMYQDVVSGINYGLSFPDELPLNASITIDLFEDEQHLVQLSKKNWGAFYVLTTVAQWKNRTVQKAAMVGYGMDENKKLALYLADQNKALALTGETSLVGTCYLPKAGVKRAYIEGKSFVGKLLINGRKSKSEKVLPLINTSLMKALRSNFSVLQGNTDSLVNFEEVKDQDSIVNDFSNRTLVIYSAKDMHIMGQFIAGNVQLKSDGQILIKANSRLSNVILYAKGIKIESGFEGNLQGFATDSIVVEKTCQLNYPSVLGLLVDGAISTPHKIELHENVICQGALFLSSTTTHRKNQAWISMAKNSAVVGQVYSSELLELKGKVIGEVYCKKLILRTPSSVYENHLMDAEINRTALSPHFVGISLTPSLNPQKIIKWIN